MTRTRTGVGFVGARSTGNRTGTVTARSSCTARGLSPGDGFVSGDDAADRSLPHTAAELAVSDTATTDSAVTDRSGELDTVAERGR